MAGIGFELRRVIGKGGLSRTLGAAIAGIFVVAGPWLLTIFSVFLIGIAFNNARFNFAAQFQGAIIYAYAGSLALFSAVHFLFTRIVADLVWENRHEEASAWMLRFVVGVTIASALLGGLVMALVPIDLGSGSGLYRLACSLLFVAVNVMWIIMLFVSLLRKYLAILLVFAAGMGAAVVLVSILGPAWGAGGAILGYAIGHALVVLGLLALGLLRYPPKRITGTLTFAIHKARKFGALILSGALFYLGQWADKFWFWASRGELVPGTPWLLYADYDVSVYLAGLSIIPGLVWFVIYSETEVSASIRRFLFSLGHEALGRIRVAKSNLSADLKRELRDQSLFQSVFSLGAAFLLLRGRSLDPHAMIVLIAICGTFFQFTLMTLLNFLYYFELHNDALRAAALFCGLNGLVFPLVQLACPAIPPGSDYILATALASAQSLASLLR